MVIILMLFPFLLGTVFLFTEVFKFHHEPFTQWHAWRCGVEIQPNFLLLFYLSSNTKSMTVFSTLNYLYHSQIHYI